MSGIYRGVNGSAVADALNIDGDKGDLTIGNSGLDWTINPDTVTFAKMQNISTDTVLGRATAGSGDVEEIPCTAAGRALLDDANAAAQRTTLGVVPGTDVLAYDANLQSFVNTFTLPTVDGTAGFILTTDGAGTLSLLAPTGVTDGDKGDITVSAAGTVWEIDAGVVSTTELGGDITAAGKALLDDADTSAQRTTLGLGSIATQEANNVSITGGSVTGITDLAVADGGTGASTAADARTNLGLVIGTDVQAYIGYTPVNKAGDTMTGNLVTTSEQLAIVRSTGDMARLTLQNTNRNWSVSNYGSQFSPNGNFAIADETAPAVRFLIDTSGRVTMPNQPSFSARWASRSFVFGVGATVWDQAVHNIGNHYNTSNGRFTAPVAGVYQFSMNCQHYGGTATGGVHDIQINGAFREARIEHVTGGNFETHTTVMEVYMNAGDYAQCVSGGPAIWWSDHSQFCGHLIG